MSRAISPVLGVVLLVAVTVLGAAALGATVAIEPGGPPPAADLRLSVDAGADRLVLEHAGGETLDVADLRLEVQVDGEALTHQPPVPFFAAPGFVSAPTGPLNPAGGTTWRAGQRGTIQLATTNGPLPAPGDHVTVTVSADRGVVADLRTVAR